MRRNQKTMDDGAQAENNITNDIQRLLIARRRVGNTRQLLNNQHDTCLEIYRLLSKNPVNLSIFSEIHYSVRFLCAAPPYPTRNFAATGKCEEMRTQPRPMRSIATDE